ncbi:MAG: hypothetical protein KC468_12170, partial [Myxococcales bacterium]|nr:hypothetical protein [Myxococcales bacterium]
MTTRSTWGRAATGWCLALTLGAGVGLTGCFNEDICWKCTSLAEGGVSHIEQAWFDQLFVATDRLTRTFDTIRADFDADALALARTFGVLDPDEVAVVHADFIRELKLVVDADIDAHVEGALAVLYTPPRCKADIPAAVDAQRTCEASHECDAPDLDVSVACLGICEGSCEGECAGERACELESSGDACDGLCAGSCALAGAAACAGTCRGACSGVCTQRDQDGACAGACAGACDGVCESSTPAACEGGCYGACLVDAGSPSCAGASRCRGACDGLCAGVCRGPLRVPS